MNENINTMGFNRPIYSQFLKKSKEYYNLCYLFGAYSSTLIPAMFKFFILLGCFLGTASITWSQTNKESYPFKKHIQQRLDADTVPWKNQIGATEFSMIGAYKEALITWDMAIPPRPYVLQEADTALLRQYTVAPAVSTILNRSAQETMVIINEAHHQPMHRVFTHRLLRGLYAQGYRYIGFEALEDSSIQTRGFATQKSGYYTAEPTFGLLISEALSLGFEVFGYEAPAGTNGKEREIAQAKNIQNFLRDKPNAKVLIHCGLDHVYEGEVPQWEKAMAGRIKEYMGIDPLTIDQVRYTERSQPHFAHYYVHEIASSEAYVLVNKQDEVFRGPANRQQTDIVVIHPPTAYVDGRPHWYIENKSKIELPTSKLKDFAYPIQVFVYRDGEYSKEGIPVDLIEMESNSTKTKLYAPKGRYEIIVRNIEYKVVDQWKINL
jgi:hypothetical protein